MPEWGERQPDGTVIVYNSDPSIAPRYESWETNQGLTTGAGGGADYTAQPAATGGGAVSGLNRAGPTTEAGLRQALQDPRVGYGGPWDMASMVAAFNRAGGSATKTGPTIAGGLDQWTNYMSQGLQADQQAYLRQRLQELEIPMSQAEREQAYAKLAMEMAQVTGYYGPAGGQQPGTQMSEEQALDAIAGSRDAGFWDFYKSNGYAVDTPEQKRSAVQNWITSADPRWKGMGAAAVASALGLGPSGGQPGGWAGLGGVAAGATGALPTFAREQWLTGQSGYLPGGAPSMAREQLYAQNWQNVANMLASKSGPRDWATYQQLQPKAAFGAMTGTPSWEQAYTQWFNAGQEPQTVAFPQPNTVRRQDWLGMSPTEQQMALGSVSAAGLDPEDWERNMQSGWATGRAAPNTTWA